MAPTERPAGTPRQTVAAGITLQDHILNWDKKQALGSEEAVLCQNDPAHGRLQVHASGRGIMCCVKGCDYVQPIGLN